MNNVGLANMVSKKIFIFDGWIASKCLLATGFHEVKVFNKQIDRYLFSIYVGGQDSVPNTNKLRLEDYILFTLDIFKLKYGAYHLNLTEESDPEGFSEAYDRIRTKDNIEMLLSNFPELTKIEVFTEEPNIFYKEIKYVPISIFEDNYNFCTNCGGILPSASEEECWACRHGI